MKTLLAWLLLIGACTAQSVTVTGSVTDASGAPAAAGYVQFTLTPTNANLPYTVTGTSILAPGNSRCGISSGTLKNLALTGPCVVWGNDVISPPNNLYNVVVAPNNKVAYSLQNRALTGNSANLSNLTAISPQPVIGTFLQSNPIVTMGIQPVTPNVYNIGFPNAYATIYSNSLNVYKYIDLFNVSPLANPPAGYCRLFNNLNNGFLTGINSTGGACNSAGAGVVGTPFQITVNGSQVGLANPLAIPGPASVNGPLGVSSASSGVYFNPDPFCAWQGSATFQDQLCDLSSYGPIWNGGIGQASGGFQLNKIQLFGYSAGQFNVYNQINGDFEPGPIALPFSSPGASLIGGSTYAGYSTDAIRVSGWCNSGLSGILSSLACTNYANESLAIQAIQAAYASNSSLHILDDMCGTQTISVQPFVMSGRFDFLSSCSSVTPHIWSVDGMGTLTTTKSGLIIRGMGGNGFLQSPTNVYIQAANCLLDNCVNSGFTVPTVNVTSFTVSGATATLVTASPLVIVGNGPAVVAPGRGLYIAGSSTANTNGLWVVQTVTDSTHYVVGVVNGTTTTCTSTCGGATASLDTPLFEIGGSTGGGVFDVRAEDLLFNCHFVIGCTGPVNGIGQENTGWGMTHVSNTDTWYYRLEQSAAYNGSGTSGDVNSGPYGPMTGNINPEVCNKTGGCPCKVGVANGSCPSSPAPVGTLMTCGAGTSGTQAIISPDPCNNNNFQGVVATGVGGAQGPRQILGLTISIQDKTASNTGIAGLKGSGAESSSGILICGSRFTALDTHIEFMELAVEIGCNSARNATWYGEYGSFITNAVSLTGGLWGFDPTGLGVDIGQAGNAALFQDICINQVAIGNSSGTIISDNIYGLTLTGSANEQGETYCHGHAGTWYGTSPQIGINPGKLSFASMLMVNTAPTITGHFNTSGDSISANNGTAAFAVTVGTGAAGSTGVIGLPTATNGWTCFATNRNRGAYIQQTASSTTSATFTNYGTTVGTPVNWTNSDVLGITCSAY